MKLNPYKASIFFSNAFTVSMLLFIIVDLAMQPEVQGNLDISFALVIATAMFVIGLFKKD